ncbi:MAG: type II secretion system protein [Lentimonas sp.]
MRSKFLRNKKSHYRALNTDCRGRAGFTLLELLGVMLIISILAAAVIPNVVDMVRVQRSVNEAAELPKLAEALKRGILREQIFPANSLTPTDEAGRNLNYWWSLAARHGGGSPNEVRYPLGIRPGSNATRKLFFAREEWSGRTFSEITGDGLTWLENPADPVELRLLIVSTANPDLPLPDQLDFEKFWGEWSLGDDGNPRNEGWASYGFDASAWAGRGYELNVERVDLRDILCEVVIENRKAIKEESGDVLASLPSGFDPSSFFAYPVGHVGSEVMLQTQSNEVVLVRRGYVVDSAVESVSIEIGGTQIEEIGSPPVTQITDVAQTIPLSLTDLAPVELIDSKDPDESVRINPSDISVSSETYFFLSGQELLLKEPWQIPETESYPKVGIFPVVKPFSFLRFDGERWIY